MNKHLLLILLVLIFKVSEAQISAITETGRQVVLYNDVTWRYNSDSTGISPDTDGIKTSPVKFNKTKSEIFMVRSTRLNVGVFMDPLFWTYSDHHSNEVNPEFRFAAKSAKVYGVMITEQTIVSINEMINILLSNARHESLDAKIISKEFRIVNGHKVLCIGMTATVHSIKTRYLAYDFTNINGTVQLLAYSPAEFYDSQKNVIEHFLNGFVEIN